MAKKVLKQLLLVTLVLCILMLGTAPVLAEQTNQELYVCLLGDSPFFSPYYTYLSKLDERIHVIESLDVLVEKNDVTSPIWLFVINSQHGWHSVSIPDGLNYQSIVFVDSITTPNSDEWEEKTILWNEYLLGFLRKGIPIYCFATSDSGGKAYSAIFYQNQCEYLDKLVTDPESGIIKNEKDEKDIVYLISTEDPETYGQLSFHIIDDQHGDPFFTGMYTAERFMHVIYGNLK